MVAADAEGVDRRRRLLEVVATSVASDAGVSGVQPRSIDGAAMVVGDTTAWIVADDAPHRIIAAAWLHARRAGVREITLALHGADAEADGSATARRAAVAATPTRVVRLEGRTPVAVEAHPPEAPPPPPDAHLEFAAAIDEAGADVVVDHGMVLGEVLGLEVCRVIDGPDGAEISVGVGRHDRTAGEMLYGVDGARERLAQVVSEVRAHRASDAEPHPLQRLAPERRLRAEVLAAGGLDGVADDLSPLEGLHRRISVLSPAPAFAVTSDGRHLVVFTTGLDLGAWADAADMASHLGVDGVTMALPERNRLAAHDELCAAVTVPISVTAIP